MPLLTRDRSFYKTLVRLAIPISLQNFITFSVGLSDNIMVGSLGEYAISGVYIGNQIQIFLQFYVDGICAALLILAAQYWGRQDKQSIKKLVSIAFRLVMAGGLLVSLLSMFFPAQLVSLFTPDSLIVTEAVHYVRIVAFSYLLFCLSQVLISTMRSVESVRIGLLISLTASLLNIGLNYLLIFGKFGLPAMGVAGVATATLISRVVECAIACVYVFVVDKKLHLKLRDFWKSDVALWRDFIRYGLPVLGGNVVWAANMLAQSAIVGQMGAEAVASMSMTGMLNNLVAVWVFGLGAGLGIITGKTVGAGDFGREKQYAVTAQVLFAGLGVVAGLTVFLTKGPFLSFYAVSQATLDVANQFMLVQSVAMVGRCYQAVCLAGLVKAGGDTGFVFLNDTIFVFGVVLPSALVAMFVFHAPAWVIYACLQSDQILKCFVAVIKINRFKWMKNLTRGAQRASPQPG